jgi:hypothetical protein
VKLSPKRSTASNDAPTTPASTPTPATGTDPAAPTTDAAASGTPTPSPAQPATIQVRRSTMLAAFAAVAVAAGAVTMTVTEQRSMNGDGRSNATEETGDADVAPSATDLVEQALAAAGDFYRTYGTFSGFTYPSTATATAPEIVLVAAAVDDVCAYSKIEQSQVYAVGIDTSGETCSPATMLQAQEVLDSYATAAAAQTGVELGHLASAVQTAGSMYASMNYVGATPSFLGLESLPVPGSTVVWVAPDGSAADVRVVSGNECAIVRITTTIGQTTAPTPC